MGVAVCWKRENLMKIFGCYMWPQTNIFPLLDIATTQLPSFPFLYLKHFVVEFILASFEKFK